LQKSEQVQSAPESRRKRTKFQCGGICAFRVPSSENLHASTRNLGWTSYKISDPGLKPVQPKPGGGVKSAIPSCLIPPLFGPEHGGECATKRLDRPEDDDNTHQVRLPDGSILGSPNENEADNASMEHASAQSSAEGHPLHSGCLIGSCGSEGLETESSTSETASMPSKETSPLNSRASLTALGETVLYHETTQDTTDSEDTMSDTTDYTDVSLIEAFEAHPASFSPLLLSLLVSLKLEVISRFKSRLQTMLSRTNDIQERPIHDSKSSSSSSESTSEITGGTSLSSALLTRGKFPADDNDGNNPGRGNDDDDRSRKPPNDFIIDAQFAEKLKKFACPFYKRFGNRKKLPGSCHGPGWRSVHRLKSVLFFAIKTSCEPVASIPCG
jgi:hypothetical protein